MEDQVHQLTFEKEQLKIYVDQLTVENRQFKLDLKQFKALENGTSNKLKTKFEIDYKNFGNFRKKSKK